MNILTFDLEIYQNYFLASFRNVDTGNVVHFEKFDGHPLDVAKIGKILSKYTLVSFNGQHFDLPLLALALSGASNAVIKTACDEIIKGGLKSWQITRQYGIDLPACDHIDLIEVAAGVASLKIYGGRMHCQKMQDLPIEPDALILPEQHRVLREYCANDLQLTADLYKKLLPQIQLRERMGAEYGADLRSKSDAQIAETVIAQAVEKSSGHKVERAVVAGGTEVYFDRPPFVFFRSEQLQTLLTDVLATPFVVAATGKVALPKTLDRAITIGTTTYTLGIGGLHSTEKSSAHFATDDTILIDRDVASYYPRIIINSGLAPGNMGQHFLDAYTSIVERRLVAKKSGDKVTDDALKITINGSFGKFGSMYSVLFAPRLLIQTTITGQLSLLMLIEQLEDAGISIVSANTDGIVIKCPAHLELDMDNIVTAWEMVTGFDTEGTYYKAIYSKDVNNYIAIKHNGVKLKGLYAMSGLSKNPTNTICIDAVVAHLTTGAALRETIESCTDVRKFISIRSVKGGAVKDGNTLGKAIRWYYAKGGAGQITYKINGYAVPRTEGAKPLMELPETLPADIDYDWYVRESESILGDIGWTRQI